MGTTPNADGSLTIDDGANPLEDLQAIADLAVSRGVMPPGTRAARLAMTASQSRLGWLYVETDTGAIYMRVTDGWRVVTEDTGWVPVTPDLSQTGFKPSGSGIRFRLKNGVVYYSVRATSAGGWGAAWSMSPIPAGFTPSEQITNVASYGTAFYEIAFNPGGTISISAAGTGGILASGSYPRG